MLSAGLNEKPLFLGRTKASLTSLEERIRPRMDIDEEAMFLSESSGSAEDLLDEEEDQSLRRAPSIAGPAPMASVRRRALFGPGVDEIFGTDIEASELGTGRQGIRKPRKRNDKVERMMAEANRLIFEGDLQSAITVLKQIVKDKPWLVLPYSTLADIHGELGDAEKEVGFLEMAATVAKSDIDLWSRLAFKQSKLGRIDDAISSYQRLLRFDVQDFHSAWELQELYHASGRVEEAAKVLEKIAKKIPEHPQVAQRLILLYRESNRSEMAIETGERCLRHSYGKQLEEDAQQQLQSLLVDIARLYLCESATNPEDGPEALATHINNLHMEKQSLSLELRVLIALCSCRAKPGHLDEEDEDAIELLLEGDPYADTELFITAASCLAELDITDYALQLLHMVYEVERSARTAMLLARCYKSTGDENQAIKYYEIVLGENSGNMESALQAIGYYSRTGKGNFERALDLARAFLKDVRLTADDGRLYGPRVGQDTLARRGELKIILMMGDALRNLLKSREQASLALSLFQQFQRTSPSQPVPQAKRRKGKRKKMSEEETLSALLAKLEIPDDPLAEKTDPEWELVSLAKVKREAGFNSLFEVACAELTKMGKLQEVDILRKEFGRPPDRTLAVRLERAVNVIQRYGADNPNVLRELKGLIADLPFSIAVANALDFALELAKDSGTRTKKILDKFLEEKRSGKRTPIAYSVWHAHFTTNKITCLTHYLKLYRRMSNNPLICLCVAVTYLKLVSNKSNYDHNLFVRGLAFLKEYATLRQREMEVTYNFGRWFHAVGLNSYARECYLSVLNMDPPSKGVDLSPEAAYNLSLIMRETGDIVGANALLFRHITF